MARGIKANLDRKQVRTKIIPIRFSDYEFEDIMVCLDIMKYDKPVSVFIRDLVIQRTKE